MVLWTFSVAITNTPSAASSVPIDGSPIVSAVLTPDTDHTSPSTVTFPCPGTCPSPRALASVMQIPVPPGRLCLSTVGDCRGATGGAKTEGRYRGAASYKDAARSAGPGRRQSPTGTPVTTMKKLALGGVVAALLVAAPAAQAHQLTSFKAKRAIERFAGDMAMRVEDNTIISEDWYAGRCNRWSAHKSGAPW